MTIDVTDSGESQDYQHPAPIAPLQPHVPYEWGKRLGVISPAALKTGLHLLGSPGTGKSRALGRYLIWQLFLLGFPIVVLDPSGGIVLNLIDKIRNLPLELRSKLWPRIRYIDVGATDYIVPSPLYERRPGDTLFAVANRLPAVLRRQDPQLQSAPILGWNSVQQCAIYAGQLAAALGRQIDFVADLIDQPRAYKEELRQALFRHPELAPAVTYFRELMDPNSGPLRERRTATFRGKLLPFLADPTMLAGFATSQPGVDWSQVIHNKELVIIDFQHEHDPERTQFKMTWWFRNVIDFAKQRGMAGRGQEFFFVIDEITRLLGQRSGDGHSILAEDLEELVAVLGRNYGANVILAHQNLSQVDERIRNILMQCGTQMIGNITNPDDAAYLARQFFRYDPYAEKKQEPVWMNVVRIDHNGFPLDYSWPKVIDYKSVEFSADEQLYGLMDKFRLPRFQFLVRPAVGEGTISNNLYRMSIERLDAGQYPDATEVGRILDYLRQKDGIPVEELVAEISSRRNPRAARSATMKNAHAVPLQAPEKKEDDDDEILREEA